MKCCLVMKWLRKCANAVVLNLTIIMSDSWGLLKGDLFWPYLNPCWTINTLRLRQNGRHFADNTFKHISLNENVWVSIKISLKFVPKGPINDIPALVQIMSWRRPGDKPLFETMMVRLPTHICITRPQWGNSLVPERCGLDFKHAIFNLVFTDWHLQVFSWQCLQINAMTIFWL